MNVSFFAGDSNKKSAGSDQVSQASPLIRVQNGMDLLQGLENRLSQTCLALNAELTTFTSLDGLERIAGQSVGERRHGSTAVDFGLGALGFELV
jgi:hypothetical protein